MLINLFMVPVIMGCALVGTIALIKAIKKINPDEGKKEEKDKEDEKK